MYLLNKQMKKDTTQLIPLVQDNGVEQHIKVKPTLVEQLNLLFYQQYLEMNITYHLNSNQ